LNKKEKGVTQHIEKNNGTLPAKTNGGFWSQGERLNNLKGEWGLDEPKDIKWWG